MKDDDEDTTIYCVVVNDEEQHSIWPVDRELPPGWRDAGRRGRKRECLAHIERVWTDMRPLSLRKRMEDAAHRPPAPSEASASPEPAQRSRTGDELVDRLSEGEHPVETRLRPDRTAADLKEAIDRGYVHVRFPDTRGGTTLGMTLDRERSELGRGDFARGAGTVRLVGDLTLNDVPVRCVAEIDLATLSGHGRLEPAAA